MSEAFIPPEGAMQYVFYQQPDFPIWVGQPTSNVVPLLGQTKCSCNAFWPVLWMANLYAVGMPNQYRIAVCNCHGRLIE